MAQAPLSRRGRGRPRQDDDTGIARDTILAAALRQFAELGYKGFSSRQLARMLGVSHGLLHIRFGTRAQLWRSCIDWGLGQLADRLTTVPREGPVEARFRLAVIHILETIDALPGLLQIVNQEGPINSERLAYLTDTIIAERYAVLEELIEEGVTAGRFRPVQSRLVFLLVAHGGGTLFAMQPLGERLGLIEGNDPVQHRRQMEEVADFVLRGLLAAQP